MKLRHIVSCLVFSLAFVACSPFQRQVARSVIDAATAACIVANAALPDAKVAEVCGVVDAFDGPLKELLSASRVQMARAEAHGHLVGVVACHADERELERLDRPRSLLDAGAGPSVGGR